MMQYVGIDVSKNKLDCAWLKEPIKGRVKTKSLNNNVKGHHAVTSWLQENLDTEPSGTHVILEATGIYHEAIALFLFEHGYKVSVVNPARPKKFAEVLAETHKTDKKDSVVLAKFGYQLKPEQWQPEPLEIRELKALLARLEALDKDLIREGNRFEKAEISKASDSVIQSLETVVEVLKKEKDRLTKEIDDHINKHPQLKRNRLLLESIPGVGAVVSRMMLAVMGGRSFYSASQVAAYLGLIPKLRESGKLKGRTVLSKAGPAQIRAKLYMAAVVAKQHNPDIQKQYSRLLKQGKTKMQAIGAAMRKLVQICFGVIKHQSEYRPQIA